MEKVTSILVRRERSSQTVASSLLLLGVNGDGFDGEEVEDLN